MSTLIQSVISAGEKALLQEIIYSGKSCDLWAYGPEINPFGETLAYEFAIRQGDNWYEIYQRYMLVDKYDEYPQLHILKHTCPCRELSPVPFAPYERIYYLKQPNKEYSWIHIANIPSPFILDVFHDDFRTMQDQLNGKKVYKDTSADIAIGLRSADTRFIIQVSAIPTLLKLCLSENEMDDCYTLWVGHISSEKEIKDLKDTKSEEYHYCQQLDHFMRVKIPCDLSKRS